MSEAEWREFRASVKSGLVGPEDAPVDYAKFELSGEYENFLRESESHRAANREAELPSEAVKTFMNKVGGNALLEEFMNKDRSVDDFMTEG